MLFAVFPHSLTEFFHYIMKSSFEIFQTVFTSIIIFLLKLNLSSHLIQGRGGEELSTELSVALQGCLLGGKSGAGLYSQQCMTSSTNLLCQVCFLICHFILYPLIMHCFYGFLLFKLIMKWLNLSQGLELIYHL